MALLGHSHLLERTVFMLGPTALYYTGVNVERTLEMLHQIARLAEQKADDLLELQAFDLLCIIPYVLTIPVITDRYRRAVHALASRVEPDEDCSSLDP